jgi:hypothetical protein
LRLRGDLNCSGTVDFEDIEAFIVALTGCYLYERAYLDCYCMNADTDGDNNVDFDDIDPFVNCIVNGECK